MKVGSVLMALMLVLVLVVYACVIDAHHSARIAVSKEPTATPTVTPNP